MSPAEYLGKIVEKYSITRESDIAKTLQEARAKVEECIREEFGDVPTIRYGGSYAKCTMVSTSYDLDILCYFPRDASDPGETLKAVFESVENALETKYVVNPKRTALRISEKQGESLHIDVVPGRFVDDSKTEVFLHQNEGEKAYLKTNPDIHISHVVESGVRDAIRLAKIWRDRMAVSEAKTFVLDLLVIKLLEDNKEDTLDVQFKLLLETFRDRSDTLTVEDPANGNNDLSSLIDKMREPVRAAADSALKAIEESGWESVFGSIDDDQKSRDAIVRTMVQADTARVKPWAL